MVGGGPGVVVSPLEEAMLSAVSFRICFPYFTGSVRSEEGGDKID